MFFANPQKPGFDVSHPTSVLDRKRPKSQLARGTEGLAFDTVVLQVGKGAAEEDRFVISVPWPFLFIVLKKTICIVGLYDCRTPPKGVVR